MTEKPINPWPRIAKLYEIIPDTRCGVREYHVNDNVRLIGVHDLDRIVEKKALLDRTEIPLDTTAIGARRSAVP